MTPPAFGRRGEGACCGSTSSRVRPNTPTFSPDGRFVFTTDFSGALRSWQTCPLCTDRNGLVAAARAEQRGIHNLTNLERAASAGP
jgi:hypothetical protein